MPGSFQQFFRDSARREVENKRKESGMTNQQKFEVALATAYTRLYVEQPDVYAMARSRFTPEELAARMMGSLAAGTGNKDGDGVKAACKEVGIKHTYKALAEYLVEL